MKKTEECFLKVKNDYLKYLSIYKFCITKAELNLKTFQALIYLALFSSNVFSSDEFCNFQSSKFLNEPLYVIDCCSPSLFI